MVLFWPLLIALLGKVGAAAATAGGAAASAVGSAASAIGGAASSAGGALKGLLSGGGGGGAAAKGATLGPIGGGGGIGSATGAAPTSAGGSGSLIQKSPFSKGAMGQSVMGQKLLGGGGGPPPGGGGPPPGGGLLDMAKSQMTPKGGGQINMPSGGGPSQGPPGGPGGQLAKGQIELPETGGPQRLDLNPVAMDLKTGFAGPGPGGPGPPPQVASARPMQDGGFNASGVRPQDVANAGVPQADPNWLLGAAKDLWGQTPPGQFFNAIGEGKAAWNNPAYSGGRKAFETARPMLKFGLEQAMGGGGGGGGPSGPPPGEDEMEDYARQQMMSRANTLGSQSPMPDWRRRLQEMQRQRLGQAGY